jgi:mannosyltransferase
MTSLATPAGPRERLAERVQARPSRRVVAIVGFVALVGVSLWLRTRALDAAFWIDEAIAVGVSSHDFLDIPDVLRLDGSPPLYYLLLHVWMQLFGSGETSCRSSSVCSPSRPRCGRSAVSTARRPAGTPRDSPP